jgi:acid stress chaperone HdeA
VKKLLAAAAVGGILAIANISPAMAAAPNGPKMTCKDFLSFDQVQRPKVIYWAEGVKTKGKPEDAVIDIASTDQVIPIIVQQCKAEPRASLWVKMDESWHKFEAEVKSHL